MLNVRFLNHKMKLEDVTKVNLVNLLTNFKFNDILKIELILTSGKQQ